MPLRIFKVGFKRATTTTSKYCRCFAQRASSNQIPQPTRTQRRLFVWVTPTEIASYWVMMYAYAKSVSFDPFSWSSNRWLRLWLQAAVMAAVCNINGSSPWGILQHIQQQPTLTHLQKTMIAQAEPPPDNKTLSVYERWLCIYSDNILLCLLISSRRWASGKLWPNGPRNPGFFQFPSKFKWPTLGEVKQMVCFPEAGTLGGY